MKIIFIFSFSGIFRDVPGCSGMFHVPGFIDARNLLRSMVFAEITFFSLEFCLNEVLNELSLNDHNFANFENI